MDQLHSLKISLHTFLTKYYHKVPGTFRHRKCFTYDTLHPICVRSYHLHTQRPVLCPVPKFQRQLNGGDVTRGQTTPPSTTAARRQHSSIVGKERRCQAP